MKYPTQRKRRTKNECDSGERTKCGSSKTRCEVGEVQLGYRRREVDRGGCKMRLGVRDRTSMDQDGPPERRIPWTGEPAMMVQVRRGESGILGREYLPDRILRRGVMGTILEA